MTRKAIVLVADEKIFPAAIFAVRRLASLNYRADTDIIVFTDSDRDLQIARAEKTPYHVSPMLFPEGIRATAAYFRLFIPNLLDKTHERVLYLDVDTYAESSKLFGLLDLPMRGYFIAAVRDLVIAYLPDQRELDATLSGGHTKYLNTGVLLIDTQAYNASGAIVRIVNQIKQSAVARGYPDQTVLNRELDGNWLELSPSFNMFLSALGSRVSQAFEPVITHFAGRTKPWHGPRFTSLHPARAEMERFFPRSPWKNFLPKFSALRDFSDAAGVPNSIAGGKRMATSIAPTIVFQNGKGARGFSNGRTDAWGWL